MRLQVDEDTQAKELVRRMGNAGHDVLTVHEAGLNGQPDGAVLAYAAQERRVLLTRNSADFLALHRAGRGHAGILAVYEDGDVTKDMTYADITRAILNVGAATASGFEAAGQFVVLNPWNY